MFRNPLLKSHLRFYQQNYYFVEILTEIDER
jgi:hypothetical protein